MLAALAVGAWCVPRIAPVAAETAPGYRLVPQSDPSVRIETRFSGEQRTILEKLNRADIDHLARLSVLVVPDIWDHTELAYSPLPLSFAWTSAYPKVLVVHLPNQVFGAYEEGRLVRWGPVSSGAANLPTPSGLFHLNWRARERRSTDNEEWVMRWYFNFQNQRGLSFHEFALPGLPASHACLRLLHRDARWLFNWGESWVIAPRGWPVIENGTPVLILGAYDFDRPPPWRSVQQLGAKITLPSGPPLIGSQ